MRTLNNHFRELDEDPYRQAHPMPPATPRGSGWVDMAIIAFGVCCFALAYLAGTIKQAQP